MTKAVLLVLALSVGPACSGPDPFTQPVASGERRAPSGAGSGGLGASSPSAVASRLGRIDFQGYPVVDRTQGGLRVGTLAVPRGWHARSNVEWKYSDCSFPVRMAVRADAPDGSAWIETYSAELFYWLEPPERSVPVGGKNLGMVHAPGIGVKDAIGRFLIARYRGRVQGLKVLGFRPIPNLAQALGKPALPGDSMAARIHYVDAGGRPVDEIFFGLLTAQNRIPYHGPQGTSYENHRFLSYAHSIGARDGRLDEMAPLLGFVAASFRPDPVWERRHQEILRQLQIQFDRNLAEGYARIAAAGRLSRQISANNDRMISMIESQRQASSRSMERTSGEFSEYIRGVEKMKDPYYGTSEQDYTYKYHWTDGSGTYRHSNDPGFDPNQGGGSWKRMEPAR